MLNLPPAPGWARRSYLSIMVFPFAFIYGNPRRCGFSDFPFPSRDENFINKLSYVWFVCRLGFTGKKSRMTLDNWENIEGSFVSQIVRL